MGVVTNVAMALTDLPALVQDLRGVLGEAWIASQSSVRREPEHPILGHLIRTQTALDSSNPPNQSSVYIGRLALAIRTLEDRKVEGISDRLTRLTSGDVSLAMSTVHEILTAWNYVDNGHHVEFIPEGTERTADLLVGGKVHVECKYKEPDSPTDRRRYRVYDVLRGRLEKLCASSHPGGLRAEVVFHDEPDPAVIPAIVKDAYDTLLLLGYMHKEGHAPACSWKLSYEADQRFDGGRAKLFLSQADRESFDVVEVLGMFSPGRTPTATGWTRNTCYTAIRCDIEEDRIGTIRSSLRTAAGQLPTTAPGIIEVEVTFISSRRMTDRDRVFGAVRKMLADFFRQNTRVSAVALVSQGWDTEDEQPVALLGRELVRNPSARIPLPKRGW